MERYESKQVKIDRPADIIYAVLSDFNNFTPILADKVEGWSATEDTCSFKVKGFTVSLHMVEKIAPKLIKVTGTEGNPMEFTFWIQLVKADESDTRMRIVLETKLNMMMKMMIGGKIQGTLNDVVDKIAEAFNNMPL